MKRVELYTCQKTKSDYVNGYYCLFGLSHRTVNSGGGYKKLAATARRLSKSIGKDSVYLEGTKWYKETDQLENGLAAVVIVTYIWREHESIEEHDFFEKGKYAYTIKLTWLAGGKKTSERYIKDV